MRPARHQAGQGRPDSDPPLRCLWQSQAGEEAEGQKRGRPPGAGRREDHGCG